MRRLATLVLVCGCGADDAVEYDAAVDAEPADAEPNDGRLPVDAAAVECVVGAAPLTAPVAGTYCTTWTRLDGVDAFPRYYGLADVTLTGVTWRTEGGKEYSSSASVQSGCLTVEGFSANGGAMTSDPIELCWSSEPRACGAMTWRQPPLPAGHWAVQLDACP